MGNNKNEERKKGQKEVKEGKRNNKQKADRQKIKKEGTDKRA
jgi:hypothetical protein